MRKLILSMALLMLVTALSGCYAKRNSLYRNPTPELDGIQERYVDVRRNWAITDNANKRMFINDLGRTWYTNHPSRLTPYPTLSYTGNPW